MAVLKQRSKINQVKTNLRGSSHIMLERSDNDREFLPSPGFSMRSDVDVK